MDFYKSKVKNADHRVFVIISDALRIHVEKYKERFKIGNQLFAMEILCVNDYDDEELAIGGYGAS